MGLVKTFAVVDGIDQNSFGRGWDWSNFFCGSGGLIQALWELLGLVIRFAGADEISWFFFCWSRQDWSDFWGMRKRLVKHFVGVSGIDPVFCGSGQNWSKSRRDCSSSFAGAVEIDQMFCGSGQEWDFK